MRKLFYRSRIYCHFSIKRPQLAVKTGGSSTQRPGRTFQLPSPVNPDTDRTQRPPAFAPSLSMKSTTYK